MYKSRKHRVPNKMDAKRPTPRHIVSKMPNVKERLLKAAREKKLVTRWVPGGRGERENG